LPPHDAGIQDNGKETAPASARGLERVPHHSVVFTKPAVQVTVTWIRLRLHRRSRSLVLFLGHRKRLMRIGANEEP
jgi:hypothetical protein